MLIAASIAYHEWITSYEEQGAAELRQLATGFGDISPVFLLGDFNVGEAVAANIKASQPGNENMSRDTAFPASAG